VDPPNLAVGQHDPILARQRFLRLHRLEDPLLGRFGILGVKDPAPRLETGLRSGRIDPEQAEQLVRPVDTSGLDVPVPDPGARRILGERQPLVGHLQAVRQLHRRRNVGM